MKKTEDALEKVKVQMCCYLRRETAETNVEDSMIDYSMKTRADMEFIHRGRDRQLGHC